MSESTADGPEGKPSSATTTAGGRPAFRSQALAAQESSDRLDELLPVTSPRLWLLAVGAAIILVALVAYTAITPRNLTVAGSGRVVGDGGIGLVTSTAAGQFGAVTADPGSRVTIGQQVAEVITANGPVPQYSQVEGTLLGFLPSPGAPITVGEWLAQVTLKVDNGEVGLLSVLPSDAAKVKEGMPVTVTIVDAPDGTPTQMQGRIGPNRSPTYDPDIIQEGLGTLEPPPGPRVVIEVLFDTPAPSGYEFNAVVLVSERTLLQQLLGLS